MAVIFDANALINLYHAGVLPLIYQSTECIVPAEVYREVVIGGQQAGHADAGSMGDIIGTPTERPTAILPELARMGIGEAAALTIYIDRRGVDGVSEDVIASDDRQFLRYLEARGRSSGDVVRYMDVAQLITDFAISGLLTKAEAMAAITRISYRVPEASYRSAMQDLESL